VEGQGFSNCRYLSGPPSGILKELPNANGEQPMKWFLALSLSTALIAPAAAQRMPSPADWDRLHLKVNWTAHVPALNKVDGIAALQLIDDIVYVQSASGNLTAINATTGLTKWTHRPPIRGRSAPDGQ
jgi:outer membrane protein assembly factor BamB